MKIFTGAVIIIGILILFSWKNIILNINTNLPGWYDELTIIWIYQNNIHHFSTLDFKNIYETNAIYPFKYTLSFAEHMYFPSLLIWIISIITKNVVAQYNILLVVNHLLIFFSALLLFGKLFKNRFAALASAFYLTYSPYFFVKVTHFQMIFFWPLLLSLYFLISYHKRNQSRQIKYLIMAGIFAGIQFISSVYLGIFNLTILTIWHGIEILYKDTQKMLFIKKFLIIIVAFAAVSFVSIIGYILVNREYHINRGYGEYVTYSANITDYIFTSRAQSSFLYSTALFQKYNNLDHHMMGEFAAFPGILPLFLALFLLFPKFRLQKNNLDIGIPLVKTAAISIILILAGFILSLGPRLFVNGLYTGIPLPYDLLLKILNPIAIIRALARWHFLVIFGFSILLGLGYIKLEEKYAKTSIKKIIFLFVVLVFIFIEFYSLSPFPSVYRNWQEDNSYVFLRDGICKKEGTILLEYPFHNRDLDGSLAKDVNYMAQILLNSTRHNCKTLSGYYGYEPPAYMKIRDEFANGFDEADIKIIKDLKIDYIKFNKYAIWEKELKRLETEKVFDQFTKVYEDPRVLILKVS